MARRRSEVGKGDELVEETREDRTSRRLRTRETAKADLPVRKKDEAIRVPIDEVNEVVVLAAVLVDQSAAARYLPRIPADSFFGKGHAAAWAVLQAMQTKGLSYDPATVHQLSGGTVDVAALEEYMRDRPVAPPNLKHHVECVHWDRTRVEAVRGPVQKFLEAIRDSRSDPTHVRSLARSISESFEGCGDHRYLREPRSVLREQSAILTERRSGRAIFPYGIDGFDFFERDENGFEKPRMIPGAAPSQCSVVVGVSGSGKTTTTARLALEQARAGRGVLYGAWEQSAGMTLEVIAALSLGWSRTDLTIGAYSEEDQRELEAEMERLSEWIRFLELPFGRSQNDRHTNSANLDAIHQHVSDAAPDVFIADLFQRALVDLSPDQETLALQRAQAMAQETKAHFILVQQLRLKDVENRPDQRPTREAIKGSSAWIDIADTIIGWYRPALHTQCDDDRIQAIVLKQRYGVWPLAVEFDWDPEYGYLGKGRSVAYDRPGRAGESLDSLLSESLVKGGKSSKGNRR